jgi:hypothetical protein
MRSMENDNVVLAVDDLDAEGAVLNRRRLLEDEQAPLLETQQEWATADGGYPLSSEFEALPWYKRPSVGSPLK